MNTSKAGLALLSAGWFQEIGYQGGDPGKESPLSAILRKETEKIIDALGDHFQVCFPGPITDSDGAANAARAFSQEDIACVIIVHAMWNEDPPLIRLLEGIKHLPIILWAYTPEKTFVPEMNAQQLFRISGTVGMLQGSIVYREMDVPFHFLFGHPEDSQLQNQLETLALGFLIKDKMQRLRIGRIGPRCEAMAGTWIDELKLRRELGPELVPLSYSRLQEVSQRIPESRVEGFLKDLTSRYPVEGVGDHSLQVSARVSLAVEELAKEHNLGAISIQDIEPELHTLCGTRPCLWTPGMSEMGLVVSAEADVLSALGLWLVKETGGEIPMYTEIFSFDQQERAFLAGHAGLNDPALAGENRVSIVPDLEYEKVDEVEGAWLHFACRTGRVRMVNFSATVGGFRLFHFEGDVILPKVELEGWAHAYIKVDFPLNEFFERVTRLGMMQHYALSYGGAGGDRLEKVASVLGIVCQSMENSSSG